MQVSLMNEREDDSFMSVDGGGLMDTSSSSPCSSMLMGSMGGANGVHNPHQQQQQGSIQQQQKTKRLRTSFKHHQLRMLKSYFATNHNPDAKDLKQLSQKTTLSKRVLQVKIFSAFKNILLYSYLVRIFFFSLLLLVTKKKTTTKTRIRETIAHHAKRIFLGDSLQLCGHRRRKLQVIAMRGSNRFFFFGFLKGNNILVMSSHSLVFFFHFTSGLFFFFSPYSAISSSSNLSPFLFVNSSSFFLTP
jgi:hypothetical protein